MKPLRLLILLSFIIAGCGGGFEITKTQNPNNPELTTYNSPKFQVKSEYETNTFYTYMQFSCFVNKNEKTYSISSSYVTNVWPFFEKMVFVIEGTEREYRPDRPPVRELEGVLGPTETITVQVPEELIIDLYESMDATIRVIGPQIKYNITVNDELRLKLYQFYKATI